MKQIFKNKIREIRQLAMLSKVDIQMILEDLEKDLEHLEEKIDVFESKYNLTYSKGTLASRLDKYMIYNDSTSSVQSSQSSTQSLSFVYYSDYNTSASTSVSGCYTYTK